MSDRRTFVRQMAGVLAGVPFLSLAGGAASAAMLDDAEKLSYRESGGQQGERDFWRWVRESYTVSPNIINLNNGGVAPQPKIVQDALDKYNRLCNEAPSYYMWRTLDAGREPLRENLAILAGCSPEEIAVNRNSTEGLNTVIFGLNLKAGDEVVLTKQDYPNMINAWKQREKRDGIKLVWVDLELPSEDNDYLAGKYIEKFTSRTKVVHITHIINWTGQIMPVRKIADEAHKRGIEVLADGAHTFAHIDYKIPDLGCDYFATSLHKWLSAPFGSGLLYIRKEKIKDVWALLSAAEPDGSDIRKFESLGTRSFASEMAIGYSLDFHNTITTPRKQARLQYLKEYWTKQVEDIPKVRFNSPLDGKYSCGIANFAIEGKEPADIDTVLFNKYKIHAVSIVWENIKGVRITPNVYTSEQDLDKLVKAIKEIASAV